MPSIQSRERSVPTLGFIPAYAKINYTLDALGKRPDGYHALASVMQTVALCDTLGLRARSDGELALVCDVPALQAEDNLALRAARRLQAEAARPLPDVTIELRKAIPAQAGLGGGSSDAASVLVALNAAWSLGLDDTRLEALGAELGSDVPFFIRGGTALIEGRGERVTPLPDAEPLWIVLARPRLGLSTAAVFRALAPADYTSGEDTAAVADAIRAGQPLPFERCFNALERGVAAAYPAVEAALSALRAAGAPVARLSGSGPTVFAPFRELLPAATVAEAVRAVGLEVWLTHTVTAGQCASVRPSRVSQGG
ncbi:MAG TPA: 4-(cytidine 5'-diphospho)-2-C-methyl-D-erythritol kinase [Ktedonobacterales bacterium]|nr:4-(cytidine 5'-diphospho)-2-C-methyl-D-erythritol kinase [Ktedonobacterales bacterium]